MGRRSVASARATPTTAQKTKGITHLQSLNVIRNMIRVSISEICYLRNLFPEELFKERVYADMNVKCLAPTKEASSQESDDASSITQWLEDGVFEALEKKYLESLVLCIYSISAKHEPEHLLESYTYTIKHASNGSPELTTSFTGAKALNCTAENVKAQAIQLIRSLVSITNNLDPLPRNRLITMKVFFNDSCPAGWQPKHFTTATAEYTSHIKAPSLKLDVGRVITPHHWVSMELETAEEIMESLSQVGSHCGVSQSSNQPDDESDVTTMGEGNTTTVAVVTPEPTKPKKSSERFSTVPALVTPPLREVTKTELLTFIVSSSTVSTQMITTHFHTKRTSKTQKWLQEFEKAGVLRPHPGLGQYQVAVHDSDLFHRAVHETHGKLKRQITTEGLAQAIDVSLALGEALLVRMEQEGLVARAGACYKVLFSETNRALVHKALQASKANAVAVAAPDQPPAPVDSVYDFEPGTCVTPTFPSKRKSSSQSSSASLSSARRQSKQSASAHGSCANAPILQVRKALKKRKVALNPIS